MKAFKSTSLADQVFDKLENDIIQGVYPKGEILTELKLVEQLGVSRTPIRDALRRLEQEDIMNIRERIEGLVAYYAALNITPEGVAELKHLTDLQDFYYSKHDAEHLRQVDDEFHDAICRLSNRTVISDTLTPLHRKTRRYRRLAMEDWNRTTQTTKEHYAISQAIIAGDAPMAKQLMKEHILHAKEHMIKGDN